MMNPEILLSTPFGFVFELPGGCYQSPVPYDIYINGAFTRQSRTNVQALFGLVPDTEYTVELRGLDLCFSIHTKCLSWLIDVRDYGAVGDGIHDDTNAIAAAIYTAPKGATIRFACGHYRASQVLLKSDVDLYFMQGATLTHNTNRETLSYINGYQWDYFHTDAQINASWEGNPLSCFTSLIYAKDVSNVRIYGQGILDGNGQASGFWQYPKGKEGGAYRPRNVSLYNCENITMAGMTSRNSACWNIHPHSSKALTFLALNIHSDPNSPNTDGLNPEHCSDVLICGCEFTVGDDCIAIKSGKRFMATRNAQPSERITIRNCRMLDGHGAVVIGSEIALGARSILIEKCLFERTDRGLRIKTCRGRGKQSVIDGITMRDCILRDVRHCFVVNMFYNCDPDGHSLNISDKAMRGPDDETPSVKNISLIGIRANGISGSAAFSYGLPESPIDNIAITDCSFEFSDQRVIECPAMMDNFTPDAPIDFFFENARRCD